MPAAALEDSELPGWPPLRQAIAEYAAAIRGINCTADQIFVVPSVEVAGRLVAQVLCKAGSFVWIEDPGPSNVRAIAESARLVPVNVAVDADGIDVAEGRRLAPATSLAVVSPTVHFPTGLRMSNERRRQLLDWSRASGSWIMEVDHALEFPFGHEDSRPLAATPNAERVVYFDTFSKLLFPSLRVAFIIVPRAIAARFQAALPQYDRPPGLPNQIVLADFLGSREFAKHLRRSREINAHRRAVLLEALQYELGSMVSLDPRQKGLFVCARLPSAVNDMALDERARQDGLILKALSPYYASHRRNSGLLLGYSGYAPAQLLNGVRALARLVEPSVGNLAAGR